MSPISSILVGNIFCREYLFFFAVVHICFSRNCTKREIKKNIITLQEVGYHDTPIIYFQIEKKLFLIQRKEFSFTFTGFHPGLETDSSLAALVKLYAFPKTWPLIRETATRLCNWTPSWEKKCNRKGISVGIVGK